MADMNPVLGAVAGLKAAMSSGINDISGYMSTLNQLATDDVRAQENIAGNAQIIETAKQAAILEEQAQRQRYANQFGIDPLAKSDLLTQLTTKLLTARAAQQASAEEIQKKEQVGFFDNPLQFVVNQITLKDDVNKHNAANMVATEAQHQIDEINHNTQTTNVSINQLAQPVTEATKAAAVANVALQGKLLADQSARQGALGNIQGINQILALKSDVVRNMFSVVSAQQAEQHIKIAMQTEARAREAFEFSKEEKTITRENDAQMWQTYLNGRALRLGADDPLAQLDAMNPKARNLLAEMRGNSPAAKEAMDDYQAGKSGILAASPAQAFDILKTRKVNLPTAQYAVANILTEAGKDVMASPVGLSKDRGQIFAAIDAQAAAILDSQLKNVKIGDDKNVGNVPSINSVVTNTPELKNLAFVRTVLGPLMARGDSISNPNDTFTSGLQAVKRGELGYNDFVLGYTAVYQRAAGVRNAERNFMNLGLMPKTESIFSYKTEISVDPLGRWGGKQVIDNTKIDQVARAANLWLTKDAMKNAAIGQQLTIGPDGTPGLTAGKPKQRLNVFPEERTPGQFYPDLFVPVKE